MNAEWQKMLVSFGVEHTDGAFQNPSVPDGAGVLCTLSGDSILHVSGDDAQAFLQGQFSNDIAALEGDAGSQLTTWSTPKGRVITLLRVIKIADGYLIKIATELLAPVLKRLRMYVLMSKVVIEPRDDLIAIGVSGEGAMKALAALGTKLPEQVDGTCELSPAGWATRVRGVEPRFEIIAEADALADIWKTAMPACTMAAESAWRLQNIDAGVPCVTAATSEAFVLQMMNLQLINGVSFKKGCFPGQEVVARMHYLGKLKRSMFRLQYEGDTTPVAGDEIFKADGGSAAGKIVDAVQASNNTTRMLAVIAIDATAEPLFLDKEAQHPLQLLELPYELTLPE